MGVISDLNFDAGITELTDNQGMVWGFRSGDRAPHTIRTIMLAVLSHLLDAVAGEVRREDYANAVMEHDCPSKRTAKTRKLLLQRLTEFYSLDGQLILFRGLQDQWGQHEGSRPVLASLLTLARDPLLRVTPTVVICSPYGYEFARNSTKEALTETVGECLNFCPYLARDLPGGKKGASILCAKLNIHWKKGRGKEPVREQAQSPWFREHGKIIGERVNDAHLTKAEKRS